MGMTLYRSQCYIWDYCSLCLFQRSSYSSSCRQGIQETWVDTETSARFATS